MLEGCPGVRSWPLTRSLPCPCPCLCAMSALGCCLPLLSHSLPRSHSLTPSPECPTVRGVPDAIIPEHSQPAPEGERARGGRGREVPTYHCDPLMVNLERGGETQSLPLFLLLLLSLPPSAPAALDEVSRLIFTPYFFTCAQRPKTGTSSQFLKMHK